MAIEHEFIEQVENKWQNVYWFARMLIKIQCVNSFSFLLFSGF
jgi:hypothetical protein